jgi:hypothetical protein
MTAARPPNRNGKACAWLNVSPKMISELPRYELNTPYSAVMPSV